MAAGLFDAVWQWLAGLALALSTTVGGAGWRTRQRSLQNQHRLEGDPDNPSDEGLMDIAFDTRQKVDNLEARMESEHREVMAKLEEMSDDDGNL